MAAPHQGDDPGFELSSRAVRVALGLIALVLLVLRWRWLDVPFERDEGEYAYGGRLLLEGVPPYVGLYNMKLPGIYAIYAALLATGGSALRAVHVGLVAADILSVLALYLVARRLFDALSGVVAAALLAVLFLLPSLQASSANAEHFVLPFALAGLALLARGGALPGRRAALAGLLLGCGLLIKQHGAFLAAAGGLALLLRHEGAGGSGPEPVRPGRWRAAAWYSAGVVLPYALAFLLYAVGGRARDFWSWTASYAVRYTQQAPLEVGLEQLAARSRALFADAPLVAVVLAAGLACLVGPTPVRRRWRFLVPLLLGSCAAVAPGLYFRPHYFVLLLPAVVLLVVGAARTLASSLGSAPPGRSRRVFLGVAALLVASVPAKHVEWLFRMTPDEVSRHLYGTNPFVESVAVGAYLARHAQRDERLLVLGSEPQLYVYSGLRGATGFVYAYPMMEQHDLARAMQERFIAEAEASDPRWMVFVRHPVSWLRRPESEVLLFDWIERTLPRYELVARLVQGPRGSRLVEGAELATLRSPAPPGMDVFRKREAP